MDIAAFGLQSSGATFDQIVLVLYRMFLQSPLLSVL